MNIFYNKDTGKSNIKNIVIVGGIALFGIILITNTIVTIPVGKIGIKTQFGAIKGNTLEAGLNFKIPFIQKVSEMNCQIQKIEIDASAASKDMQTVTSKIAVNYSIDKNIATTLYKEIGLKYQDIIISPTIQEVIKGVTAQYTAEELITKRSDVSTKISENLITKLESKGITISGVNIINFDFSTEYNKAIEAKSVAQQSTLKAQQDLERIKVEAEQTITKAKAEAEAMRLQKQELTPELIQKQAIEKWNGILPTTTAGQSIPFINIK